MAAGCIQSFQRRTNDKTPPAPRHFDRSAAEWRNLTPQMTETLPRLVISTEAERSGEISRPPWYRVHGGRSSLGSKSREPPAFTLMPAGSSARDDLWACILPSENRYGKKGCEEMICISSRSFFVGEIPWGCEMMAHHRSFRSILSHPCLWSMDSCKNKVLDRKKAFSYN